MSSYKTVVNIDSLYRENYDGTTSSNFDVWLPKQLNNVTSMRLMAAEIPNTIYLFSSKKTCIGISNNTFRINMKDTKANIECTVEVIIPDGVWFSSEIVKYINERLTNIYYSASYDSPINILGLLIFDISEETGKAIFRFKTQYEAQEIVSTKNQFTNKPQGFDYMTYYDNLKDIEYTLLHPESLYYLDKFNDIVYNSQERTIDPSVSHELLSNTALYILGFKTLAEIEKPVKYSNKGQLGQFMEYIYKIDPTAINLEDYMNDNIIKNNWSNGYIESSSVYGESRISYFYISINDYVNSDKNQVITCKKNGMTRSDIIAKIQIQNSSFNFIIDNNKDLSLKERQYYGPSNIKKLSITILDKFGKVVDLNNSEISLSLEFTIAE